jgi:hypothetical protein
MNFFNASILMKTQRNLCRKEKAPDDFKDIFLYIIPLFSKETETD